MSISRTAVVTFVQRGVYLQRAVSRSRRFLRRLGKAMSEIVQDMRRILSRSWRGECFMETCELSEGAVSGCGRPVSGLGDAKTKEIETELLDL